MGHILIIASFLAILDQMSKILIGKYLDGDLSIIGEFFQFQYSENRGIAFGIGVPKTALIILTILLIFVILYYAIKELKIDHKITKISIALIIGGAIGNLIDRLVSGYVIDFIAIWSWPNFNLADIFITVGVLLILVNYGKINRA